MDIVVSLIKIYIEMAHLGYTAMTSFVDLAIDLLCGAFKLWVKEIDVPVFTRERRPFLLLSLSIVPLSEGSTVQSQSEMAICNSKVVKRTSRRFNGIWMSLAEVTGRKEGTLSLLPLCRDRDVGVVESAALYELPSLLEYENAPISTVVFRGHRVYFFLSSQEYDVISVSIMLFRY